MIVSDHYDKCSDLLRQLIEQHTPIYKEVVKSKRYEVNGKSMRYEAYKDGFNPDNYRELH
jgi:hypothetical protein